MKKYLSFAVTAMAILGLGSLTSCHDEDFDVSTEVLQERAFEEGFIKEFGKPDANQSFDFYAQTMQSLREKGAATRATMVSAPTITNATQPGADDADFQNLLDVQIDRALKEGADNSNVGQNNYSLVSTGKFNIYAVRYVGAIERSSGNQFRFGMAYLDDEGEEQRVELFTNHSVDSNNNPGLAKTIDFTKGQSFYFYIQYYESQRPSYARTVRFYSNQVPRYITGRTYNYWTGQYDYSYRTYSDYGGTSTLLYSSEMNGKQYMIIGFEDAWAYGENPGPDYDFNDIVIVLEGELPVPTSKRFFCEDLQSYDWDYNDVVFDVTSTGIVLRAVGGSLPVYLQINDKNGDKVKVDYNGNSVNLENVELHDLMWSMQSGEEKHKHPEKKYVRDGKTYYKPIRAGADPGLAIEAVQLVTWHYGDMAHAGQGLALNDDELVRFANPKATNPVGAVKLIVGTVDGETIVTGDQTVEKDGSFTVIEPYQGVAPAIWSAPTSVAWVKEMVKITKAYPGFYGGGDVPEGTGGIPMWWSDVNLSNTYQFSGDNDPDRDNSPYNP